MFLYNHFEAVAMNVVISVTIVCRQGPRIEEFKALFITYHFLYKPYNSGLLYNERHCNKYSLRIQEE